MHPWNTEVRGSHNYLTEIAYHSAEKSILGFQSSPVISDTRVLSSQEAGRNTHSKSFGLSFGDHLVVLLDFEATVQANITHSRKEACDYKKKKLTN